MRTGGKAWERAPGHGLDAGPARERREPRPRRAASSTEALTPANRSVAEDRGLAFIEGARARHCRISVDGDTLRRAVPEVEFLIGQADISRWRVDLDYWVFTDGELGQADGRATGPAGEIVLDALTAVVRFRLTAVDRGLPVTVLPPVQ